MPRNSNTYTLIFAAVFTGLCGILLAVLSTALNPMQERNRELETKSNILSAVGYIGADAEDIESTFDEHITQLIVNQHGEETGADGAFDIDVRDEYRQFRQNPEYEMRLPVYIYTGAENNRYIFPLSGNGLWGALWGYIALESDFNTVYGASFDHAGETPGLGAEIRTTDFQQRFQGKKIFDNSELVSVTVHRGTGNPTDEHSVDGLSGATITVNGVNQMLIRAFESYKAWFSKNTDNLEI